VLFVGMLSGTYSSICIATPVLADLKERQPEYKDLAVKVRRRLAGGRRAADAGSTAVPSAVAEAGAATQVRGPQIDDRTGPDSNIDSDSDVGIDDTGIVNDGIDNEGDGVTVPPARARTADAATTGATRPSPASRPQRTGGSAQRRPGARKKRR
jgi:preprotein translocase subunit SecF